MIESYQYAYSLQLLALPSDGSDPIDLSDYLIKLAIDIDFKNMVFPCIHTKFNMMQQIIVVIQQDPKIRFSLRIINAKTTNSSGQIYDDFISSTILVPLLFYDTPLDVSDKIIKSPTDNITKEIFEMKLIPEECLKANKPLASGVYQNISMLEAACLLGQKCENNLFIEPLDNIEKYSQVPLLPYNVFANLHYLDQVYGFYNSGLKIFYGFNQFRINSNNYKNEDKRNNVYISFDDDNNNNGIYTSSCNRSIGGDFILYNNINNVSIMSNKIANNEIMGNNILLFSNEEERKYIGDVAEYRKKTRAYSNRYNNLRKEREIYNEINKGRILQMTFDSIDLRISDLFKVFNFFFNNKIYSDQYNGAYSPIRVVYTFNKTQGDIVSMIGAAIFQQI